MNNLVELNGNFVCKINIFFNTHKENRCFSSEMK